MSINNPTAFVSYSWDDEAHKFWVSELAARLRGDGIDVKIDQWETTPGDQLPAFMEKSIRDNEYILIVCTPKYKQRSDNRDGGVGYEGDIMTAEISITQNHRKFVPILRKGDWRQAAPAWLSGKYFVDLRGDPYQERSYDDILTTIYGTRPTAPPLGPIPERFRIPKHDPMTISATTEASDEIKIMGIIVDEVSQPTLDGTRGSALYRVPFQLSKVPTSEWSQLFVQTWNHPASLTSMHRSGTASVEGDRIFLNRTTIEEVEQYHRDTLVFVVRDVNQAIAILEQTRVAENERRLQELEEHRKNVAYRAKKIKFD